MSLRVAALLMCCQALVQQQVAGVGELLTAHIFSVEFCDACVQANRNIGLPEIQNIIICSTK